MGKARIQVRHEGWENLDRSKALVLSNIIVGANGVRVSSSIFRDRVYDLRLPDHNSLVGRQRRAAKGMTSHLES